MKKLFLISIFIGLLSLTSCNDWSKGKFRLTNNTLNSIDSICISPDKYFGKNCISLKPNETKYYETDMGEATTDGGYLIKYKIGLISKSQMFGYFSNGNSMEKLTKIYFQTDTLKIESEYSKY